MFKNVFLWVIHTEGNLINSKDAITFFKIMSIVLLLLYVKFFEMTIFTNKIDAVLTLLLSILFLYKSRKNQPVSLVAFFILYCNYSLVMGEYLVGGNLAAPMFDVKTLVNYGISIRTLLLFISILTLFYKANGVDLSKFKLVPKGNLLIFYGLFSILIYILLFQVNRSDLSTYSVRISPLYEYSTILFLFAYYSSGKSLLRRFLITSLIILFVLQDFYYGGRVTSMQLILLFLVTIFAQKLSFKFTLLGGFVGIFLNGLVGAYRGSYSINSTNILDVFVNLKNGYFVFNTPVFAYYASATHVAASQIVSLDIKLNSFLSFIVSIFIGSNNEIGDLSTFVRNHYFTNVGGGIIPTYFYFWLGWAGVVLISGVVVLVLNKLGDLKNDFQKLCAVVVILTVPRWYLYTPLSLFRPLILLTILYLIFLISHKVLSGIPSRNKSLHSNHLNPVINEISHNGQ